MTAPYNAGKSGRPEIFQDIDAFIFDMDGVLTDTEILHEVSERLACHQFGLAPPLGEWEKFKGQTALDIARYLVGKYGNGKTVTPEQFVEAKRRKYIELLEKNLRTIPGAVAFVLFARKYFEYLALTTSSMRMEQELICYNLSWYYFDAIVTGDDIPPGQGKPHPAPYLQTAEKLEVEPRRCIVLEDSVNGITSARKAGCKVIGIATSHSQEELAASGAHITVGSFASLFQLFNNGL